MPSIGKRVRNGQKAWRAHYRTPAGAQRNKTFARKIDAERFLATVESAKLTGPYVDPQLAKVTIGRMGRPLAGRPSPSQALYPSEVRRDRPQAHSPEVGPGQARRGFSRRCPGLGHVLVQAPVPGQCCEDPPGAEPRPRHGGQRWEAGPQRGQRRQPTPSRQARAPLPDPRPGRRPRTVLRLPG
jgi:hypothetical protein